MLANDHTKAHAPMEDRKPSPGARRRNEMISEGNDLEEVSNIVHETPFPPRTYADEQVILRDTSCRCQFVSTLLAAHGPQCVMVG